jgi:hypothetical protein
MAVLGMAAAGATAQTVPVPPIGGYGQSQMLYFDDGVYELGWRISFFAAVGDAYAVDFDDMCGNMTVTGVAMATMQTSFNGGTSGIRYIALCPDNLGVSSLGRTPDLSAPLAIRNSTSGAITGTPGPSAGFCPGQVGYDTPDLLVGTTGGLHAVTNFLTGDSASFMCSDTNQPPAGHSTFSVNGYSTPAIVESWDYSLRAIGAVNPAPGSAYLTVNNATAGVVLSQTAQITVTLWSTCATQPTAYLQGVFVPTFIPIPSTVLFTGYENGSSISDQFQGTISAPLSDPSSGPCVPAGSQFDIAAFYLDNCTLKKNGKPKLRITNSVDVTVTADFQACNPCVCWGQLDDGHQDFTIWKVQNPAGTQDYFNINQGSFVDPNTGSGCGTTVTSIQVASWDFCGTGPSWGSIGIYAADTGLDPSGNTPALGSPAALTATLSMAPGAADSSYPATTYDINPDVTTTTSSVLTSASTLHTAVKWATGDTCSWMGGDSDGTDDASSSTGACSVIPNSTAFFTVNGFSSPSIAYPFSNWMQKVDWF